MDPQEESWWLDSSGNTVMWARLRVFADGKAEIFDLDGKYHHFAAKQDAVLWLLEDEYSVFESATADLGVLHSMRPPEAATEAELVHKMIVQL